MLKNDIWKTRFQELSDYKLKYGNCLVPTRYSNNLALGRWVMTQRRQYQLLLSKKKSLLTSSRVKDLDDLGFSWNVREDHASVWEKQFEELRCYYKKYGHSHVPQRYKINRKLGIWVNSQRRQYRRLKEGKISSMTEAKIQKLKSIGFSWKLQTGTRKKDIQECNNLTILHGQEDREMCKNEKDKMKNEKGDDNIIGSTEISKDKSMQNEKFEAGIRNKLNNNFYSRETNGTSYLCHQMPMLQSKPDVLETRNCSTLSTNSTVSLDSMDFELAVCTKILPDNNKREEFPNIGTVPVETRNVLGSYEDSKSLKVVSKSQYLLMPNQSEQRKREANEEENWAEKLLCNFDSWCSNEGVQRNEWACDLQHIIHTRINC